MSVSIPNGMEFYIVRNTRNLRYLLFQFPTGWNSTKIMGLLEKTEVEFQFPTGWNSTKINYLIRKSNVVSIPNGMEFYKIQKIKFHLYQYSFNSQRDGILLDKATNTCKPCGFQFPTGWNSTLLLLLHFRRHPVSIPNGMEFYKTLAFEVCKNACFNSQRDGILLKEKAGSKKINTSFNSQRDGILPIGGCRSNPPMGFQFPTGWNSTLFESAEFLSKVSFQFPTGWNSTFWRGELRQQARVSIPNGMEFYSGRKNSFDPIVRFQFPTGWNSTLDLCREVVKSLFCFNSQRDGILLAILILFGIILVRFQFPTGWNSTIIIRQKALRVWEFQFPTGWNSTRT